MCQGTLADLNHLFLAAYHLQKGSTHPSAFFPRIDCTSAAGKGGGTRIIGNGMPYSEISKFPYFESNIVGSINFPAGVSHVLAPFLTYWGTEIGQKLQVIHVYMLWRLSISLLTLLFFAFECLVTLSRSFTRRLGADDGAFR